MSEATIIYPHQLFAHSPATSAGRIIYLVEEPFLLTHNPIHRQKLILHKLTLDAYQKKLESAGFTIVRLSILTYSTTASMFARIKADGVTTMHIVDTTDYYLEQAIKQSGIARVIYDSPLFILSKDEAMKRFIGSKKFMATFYKQLRRDKKILLNADGTPTGGKWSLDADNRKKLPNNVELPVDIQLLASATIAAATIWADKVPAEQYGDAGCWLPSTHAAAEKLLQGFFRQRFVNFGAYEDAIHTDSVRLFHSALSPLINIGLLTPQYVLDEALHYAEKNEVPLNSLEGFVRQILGWREFIRASYECDGAEMRTQNFFNHTRSLPASFWSGTTGISPVDQVIKIATTYGYTHHIERLMVMGNFLLLTQIHPNDVYRWFMGMYVDAYDWVMVPNVYGMSQFADGGSFATKPYISGANYLKKMSNYKNGEWEAVWTALYWHFIETHAGVFKQNYRLNMMPHLLEKMSKEKRVQHQEISSAFLETMTDRPQ